MSEKHIGLSEDELLMVQRIVIDGDKEEALVFIREVIKKKIDRADNSKMIRENI